MPLLQSIGQAQCNTPSVFNAYTVPSCACGEIEASQDKCLVPISDIPHRHYSLRNQMMIEVAREGPEYIVSQPETGIFAYDADLREALRRFFDSFVEQFEFLRNNFEHLSPALKRDLVTLEELIEPR